MLLLALKLSEYNRSKIPLLGRLQCYDLHEIEATKIIVKTMTTFQILDSQEFSPKWHWVSLKGWPRRKLRPANTRTWSLMGQEPVLKKTQPDSPVESEPDLSLVALMRLGPQRMMAFLRKKERHLPQSSILAQWPRSLERMTRCHRQVILPRLQDGGVYFGLWHVQVGGLSQSDLHWRMYVKRYQSLGDLQG